MPKSWNSWIFLFGVSTFIFKWTHSRKTFNCFESKICLTSKHRSGVCVEVMLYAILRSRSRHFFAFVLKTFQMGQHPTSDDFTLICYSDVLKLLKSRHLKRQKDLQLFKELVFPQKIESNFEVQFSFSHQSHGWRVSKSMSIKRRNFSVLLKNEWRNFQMKGWEKGNVLISVLGEGRNLTLR